MNPSNTNAETPLAGDILIVDDTPANLRLLSEMLVEQGHKVRLAPSGKLALMAAQVEPPDLILLDVMMPEMDGYAVCKQSKADQRTRDILAPFQPLVAEIGAKLGLESVTVSGHKDLENDRVLLSRRGIELVLWEILDNSKKFHPEQAPSVEIIVSSLGSHEISIQIGDDGLVLSPEQLAQVWTPYCQSEKDFTGEVTGMGLGLSLVASMVWQVGGTCHIYNRKEGRGIIVELVLPLEEKEN